MTWDDAQKQAEQMVGDIVTLTGGPITTRDDAVKLVATALREAFQAGWDSKQQQLSAAMYPR